MDIGSRHPDPLEAKGGFMMKNFEISGDRRTIQVIISSDHIDADIRMSHVYRVIQDEHSSCDLLSCSAKGGFSVYDRVKNSEVHTAERFEELVRQVTMQRECGILMENRPPLLVTPPYDAFPQFGREEAQDLMKEVLAAGNVIEAKKLRMTQFGFLQTDKNEPEFEGVLDIIRKYLQQENGTIQSIFFDIDERREGTFLKLVSHLIGQDVQ